MDMTAPDWAKTQAERSSYESSPPHRQNPLWNSYKFDTTLNFGTIKCEKLKSISLNNSTGTEEQIKEKINVTSPIHSNGLILLYVSAHQFLFATLSKHC